MLSKRTLVTAAAIPLFLVLLSFAFLYAISPLHLAKSRKDLHKAKRIDVPGFGPESLAWDPQGEGPYVGVSDGRILKWNGDDRGWSEFAVTSPIRENCSGFQPEREHICGRALGLHFEKKSGDLYIADGYLGVLKVGPKGGLAEKVVNEADGRKFTFTNDLDIDEEEDAIYVTDSSDKYEFRNVLPLFFSGESNGRLIRYDKKTKEAKVLMTGLKFPNGVALSKDGSFVLVGEPPESIVHRYWLRGPKAGTHHVFAKLPGYSDNIVRNERGEFWVANPAKQGLLSRLVLKNPTLAKLLVKTVKPEILVFILANGIKPHAMLVKLGENGEVLDIVEDGDGKNVKLSSEGHEKDGKLWVGSFVLPHIWVYDL